MPLDTVVCIGTGPSLTPEQIQTARGKGFRLFGCNLTYEIAPDLEVLYAVNENFWFHYWDRGLADHAAAKWTTSKLAAAAHGINWIGEKNRPGLSTDPAYVHHGHGSGYTLVNLAYLFGAKRIILLGYDLRYAPDYNGRERKIGSMPRHYFGEYPSLMQHWPKQKVRNGVHFELVELYRTVADQGLVEIVNATPGSAIDCFERRDIEDC